MNKKNIFRIIASAMASSISDFQEVTAALRERKFSDLPKEQKRRNFGKSKRFSSAKKSPYRSKLVMFNSGIFPDRFRGV